MGSLLRDFIRVFTKSTLLYISRKILFYVDELYRDVRLSIKSKRCENCEELYVVSIVRDLNIKKCPNCGYNINGELKDD